MGTKASEKIIDVGPYMPAMRRRSRDLLIMQNLEALQRSLEGEDRERVTLLLDLMRPR